MAWITKQRVQGRHYVYLREYRARKEFSATRQRTVYNFGQLDNAINTLKAWCFTFPHYIPVVITNSYQKKDLIKWLKELEEFKNDLQQSKKVI